MSITVLLASAKTWFLGIGVGMKAAVIATSVAVVGGAVAVPVVIFTTQDDNSGEVGTASQVANGEGVELSAEQQEYCNNMMTYMTNNNGKVPEGENREAVLALCFGESGTTSSHDTIYVEYDSLEEASKVKWEAENCENVRVSEWSSETRCRKPRPWNIYEQDGVIRFSDIGSPYGLGVAMGACVAVVNGVEQPTGPNCKYDSSTGTWTAEWNYPEAPEWISQLERTIYDYHAARKEFVTANDIGDTPLKRIAGVEHGYEIIEPLSEFPQDILRTDCERKTVERTKFKMVPVENGQMGVPDGTEMVDVWSCPEITLRN